VASPDASGLGRISERQPGQDRDSQIWNISGLRPAKFTKLRLVCLLLKLLTEKLHNSNTKSAICVAIPTGSTVWDA
jgi:hypothetical protein